MANDSVASSVQIVTKLCRTCNTVKPTSSFHKCSKAKCGTSSACKTCVAETAARNKPRAALSGRKYYLANRSKVIARAAMWRLNHPGHGAAHYARNRVRLAARAKLNRTKFRDHIRVYRRQYRIKKRSLINTINRNRRALKRGATGSHSKKEVNALLIRQHHRCANPACLKSIRKGFHCDHIVALINGGSNWISNIQLLCPPCNMHKHTKDPLKWANENGFLL